MRGLKRLVTKDIFVEDLVRSEEGGGGKECGSRRSHPTWVRGLKHYGVNLL